MQTKRYHIISFSFFFLVLIGLIAFSNDFEGNKITASVIGTRTTALPPRVIGMSKGPYADFSTSTECNQALNRAVYLDWEQRGIGLEFDSPRQISRIFLNSTGRPLLGIDIDIYVKNNQGKWQNTTGNFDEMSVSPAFDVRYTTCKGRMLSITAVQQFTYGAINPVNARGLRIVTRHPQNRGLNVIPRLQDDLVVE